MILNILGEKIFLILSVFAIINLPSGLPVLAQSENLESACQNISESENSCQSLSSGECRTILEKCAIYYDNQSVEITKDLTKTKQQKDTLQSQISSLKKKIKGLEYQINQGTLIVKDLNIKISDTQVSIDRTSEKINDLKNQIADILRIIYEENQKSSLAILLEGDLSDFFGNLVYLENLNSRISDILENSNDLKIYLEDHKGKIDKEKNQLQRTIQIQNLQKKENEQNKKQQESYLKITEVQYQQQQKEKQEAEKKSALIKSRIFGLLGVSDAPTFENAYNIAKYVSSITGVRAALIMAILTQESNLGKNVGQCYLKDISNGDGVKIKTGAKSPKTMSPKRDIPVYLSLIEEINKGKGLFRDPFLTPVSCVIYYNGSPYGWGGAMGPAQFIPSTWVSLGYGKKVSEITGKASDPWDINDAFLATGLLLKDNGAKTNEFNAAMKYYCGGSCTRYDRFYGNSVLNIAKQYEADIKAIGG
jgi:peptidoglycan hydrolase CwlO-like protein